MVTIKRTENKGRGLFSERFYQRGETVLLEKPLVALQSRENLKNVLVCGNCFGFVGSLESQLLTLRGDNRDHIHSTVVDKGADYVIAQTFMCPQNCGEVYCSVECQHLHFQECHRFLCTGPITENEAKDHPLMKFKIHAVQTNEIFLLVAVVVCKILSRFEQQGGIHMSKAREPFADFVQHCWWDVVAPNLSSTLRMLVEESCTLLKESIMKDGGFEGLDEILNPEYFSRVVGMFEQNNLGIRCESPVGDMLQQLPHDELLNLKSLLIEAVNGSKCDPESCEQQEEQCLSDCEEHSHNSELHQKKHRSEGEDSKASCHSDEGTSEGEDSEASCHSDGDCEEQDVSLETLVEEIRALSVLDGTALFTQICAMNHSCDPNCVIEYSCEKGGPLLAKIIALKDIEAEEELFQSYINKNETFVERQEALKDYGFACDCGKCKCDYLTHRVRSRVII